jgi:DNA-directed RNA polymerase specialized sigma24 family protein
VDAVPLDQLERTLERELSSDTLRTRFAGWARHDPALAGLGSPAALLRFLRSRPSPVERDAVLRPLVVRASNDAAAGRLVLHALLPGLMNLARRLLINADERDELWASLLCCTWERICTYSVTRRPNRIAANLLLDTMHATLAEVRQAHLARALPPELILAAKAQREEGDIDALLRAATTAGAVTSAEAELVLATRFDGIPLAHVAEAHGEPYNRVKVRRQRAERRLLVWLGYRPVPRGQQNRPFCSARVVGAGHRPDRRF